MDRSKSRKELIAHLGKIAKIADHGRPRGVPLGNCNLWTSQSRYTTISLTLQDVLDVITYLGNKELDHGR